MKKFKVVIAILAVVITSLVGNAYADPASTPIPGLGRITPQDIGSGAIILGASVAACHNLHRVPGVTIRGRGPMLKVAAVLCYGIMARYMVEPITRAFGLPEGVAYLYNALLSALSLDQQSAEAQEILEDLQMGDSPEDIARRHGLRVVESVIGAEGERIALILPREIPSN